MQVSTQTHAFPNPSTGSNAAAFEQIFRSAALNNDFSAMYSTEQQSAPQKVHTRFFNSRDAFQRAPLHYSASIGDLRMTEALLAHGSHPDLQDNQGYTPLMWAAVKGHTAVVQSLIERFNAGVNLQNAAGETALFLAVREEHADVVKFLLQNGADPNVPSLSDEGMFPLHVASAFGSLQLVALLVSFGAWTNSESLEGDTPLHVAVRENKSEIVEWLLSHGADADHENEDEESPRMLAQEIGTAIVKALFSRLPASARSGETSDVDDLMDADDVAQFDSHNPTSHPIVSEMEALRLRTSGNHRSFMTTSAGSSGSYGSSPGSAFHFSVSLETPASLRRAPMTQSGMAM